nr:schlafen-like protein 1 isoform X2 [Gasterosteus aculeatus aculeatus]
MHNRARTPKPSKWRKIRRSASFGMLRGPSFSRVPKSHPSYGAVHSTIAVPPKRWNRHGYSCNYRRGGGVGQHWWAGRGPQSTNPGRTPSPQPPRPDFENLPVPNQYTPVQDIASCHELVYGAYLGNETQHLEFKRGGFYYLNKIFGRDARKYGCAFLNSGGGSLLVGVCDNGVVCGVSFDHKETDRTLLLVDGAAKLFSPPLFPHNYLLRFLPVIKPGEHHLRVLCLTFKAPPVANLYRVNKGQVYLRQDGSVWGPLSPAHTRELKRQRWALQAGQPVERPLAGHVRWLQETLAELERTTASLRWLTTAGSERWSSRLRKDMQSSLERLCRQIRERVWS